MPGLFIRSGKLYQLYRSYLSTIFGETGSLAIEFSNKMNLTIQRKIFNNVKHRQGIYLKYRDRFFTLLTMLGCEAKVSTRSVIKENLIFVLS